MSQFQNILVGVDLGQNAESLSGTLSPPNAEAVEQSLRLAEEHGAQLCFTAVLNTDETTARLIHDARSNDTNIFDEAHALLGQLVERARQRGILAESRVLLGKSWLRLIQEVLKSHFDLIIVGTRHEGLVDRVLFGSTAIKLLRKCPCPVWVTRPSDGLPLSSVLVAHDLRTVGRQALALGVELARSLDLQLYVIHGIEYLTSGDPTGFGMPSVDAEQVHQEVSATILAELGDVKLSRTPEIRVVSGSPERAILDLVKERSIDLVIMGTVGRAGIRGVLTGNTAERLLPQLQCSLLALKPDGFDCPIDPVH